MHPKHVLFICKKNESYASYGKRSGLYNSTRFVAEALVAQGISASVVEVVDNNDIDREVTKAKADIVIIEALWVVPEKFDILKKLHPKVRWCVHLHSNAPFLAIEGVAIEWIKGYEKRGVWIITNSASASEAVGAFVSKHLYQLNNVYSGIPKRAKSFNSAHPSITIGCFGAVRPMKNHLTQALAALKFARSHDLYLRFVINATRSETGGDPVLKNLRALFHGHPHAELVEIGWLDHPQFLQFLEKEVDLAMQVSLSETFNIVTADAVISGLPVVVSNEVGWVVSSCQASTDSVDDMVGKIETVLGSRLLVKLNQWKLKKFSEQSAADWFWFVTSRAP